MFITAKVSKYISNNGATNKEYYITTQGELVRVVDGQILTSKDAGFKDKPKKK